jgi:hypothetical protein
VLAPTPEGYQMFAYNPEQKRWSYGEAPKYAPAIEKAIRTDFIRPSAAAATSMS